MPSRAQELRKEFGSLAAYFWQPRAAPATTRPSQMHTLAALTGRDHITRIHCAVQRFASKRGWSFVGPTTMYAFMQAMGLVNDHIEGCHARAPALAARAALRRP